MIYINPYSIRCYNQAIQGKPEEKYSKLGHVGQNDTYKILCSFIAERANKLITIEGSERVYTFSDFQKDDDNRCCHLWINSGTYGTKNDIIDIKTGDIEFEKKTNNAEIIKHFAYFSIPSEVNEGIALFHSQRGSGIKTLFHEEFKEYFTKITSLNLQLNPLSYKKGMDAWLDGVTKEIRITRFDGADDVATILKGLGHVEKELVLKPKEKGALGKLRDYVDGNSEKKKTIELLTPYCSRIKTTVEINGKKRSFSINSSDNNLICEIEAPEDLPKIDGNPTYEGMLKWCEDTAKDFSASMYYSGENS